MLNSSRFQTFIFFLLRPRQHVLANGLTVTSLNALFDSTGIASKADLSLVLPLQFVEAPKVRHSVSVLGPGSQFQESVTKSKHLLSQGRQNCLVNEPCFLCQSKHEPVPEVWEKKSIATAVLSEKNSRARTGEFSCSA